jgi:peptidoglycan/LPS O-acetylase OafA/YrhL
MDVPTRSSRKTNWRAWGAVLLGLASVAAVPAAIAYTHYEDVDLIRAGWAIVPGIVLGILALVLARRARRRTERTIGRVGGVRVTKFGRFLGALGIYAALAAAGSIAVYELLNRLSA